MTLGQEGGHEGVVVGDQAEIGGSSWGSQVIEELGVCSVEVAPLFRKIFFEEDRLDRTDRLARAAIDAFVGVDVERAATFVDAIYGALLNASFVFNIHAGLRDDVGHDWVLPKTASAVRSIVPGAHSRRDSSSATGTQRPIVANFPGWGTPKVVGHSL